MGEVSATVFNIHNSIETDLAWPPRALLQFIQSNCWDSHFPQLKSAVVLFGLQGAIQQHDTTCTRGREEYTLVCVCVPWGEADECLTSIDNQLS